MAAFREMSIGESGVDHPEHVSTGSEKRFHRDPKAIGKSITLGGVAYTVIGVLPPKFHLPATFEGMDQLKPQVWTPFSRLFRTAEDDTRPQLLVTARLKLNVSGR